MKTLIQLGTFNVINDGEIAAGEARIFATVKKQKQAESRRACFQQMLGLDRLYADQAAAEAWANANEDRAWRELAEHLRRPLFSDAELRCIGKIMQAEAGE